MQIETTIDGLTKAKASKLTGCRSYDHATGIARFEWAADQDPPHDYATAMDRVGRAVEAAGGTVRGHRLIG